MLQVNSLNVNNMTQEEFIANIISYVDIPNDLYALHNAGLSDEIVLEDFTRWLKQALSQVKTIDENLTVSFWAWSLAWLWYKWERVYDSTGLFPIKK